jgi:hypothetical protein
LLAWEVSGRGKETDNWFLNDHHPWLGEIFLEQRSCMYGCLI